MTIDAPAPLLALLAVGAVVLAVGGPLSLLRLPPALLVAVYAFVLPWGSTIDFPVAPAPFNTLSTLAGMALTFSLVLRLVVGWRSVRSVEGSVVAWVALVGWLVLTLVWSVAPGRTVQALAVLVSLMGLFVLGSLLPMRPRELGWIGVGAVGGGMVVAVQALLTLASGGLQATSSELPRFTYDDGDPNIIAASLLLPLAIAAWAALADVRSRTRAAAALSSLVIFGGVVVTGSRGGLLSALVVLVVVLIASPGLRPRRLAGGIGGVAVLIGLLLLVVPEGLRSHLSDTDSTGRSAIWRVGAQACLTVCDVGTGYGTFGSTYRQTYLEEPSLQGFGDELWAAHNSFLSIVVEAGVPGLLLLLLGFGLLVRRLLSLAPGTRGAALGAIAGLLTSNMLVSNLGFKYFWMTLLYATLCVTVHAPERTPTAPLVER